ncbi:transmembrane protein 72-like [Pomacea canaliculata]|nr:transmembrane protein 72-like [Pomacea canaliculata]
MKGPTCACCFTALHRLCQTVGLLTALGLWGVGVEALFYHHDLGFYLLPLAMVVSFLELVFLITYFVEICISQASMCIGIWDRVLWLDDWRKGLLYVILSVPCFISPREVMLAVVSGVMLAVTGLLYSIKTFKTRRERPIEKILRKKSYDRFKDPQEDLEDCIVNPTDSISVMNVADQIEILEV